MSEKAPVESITRLVQQLKEANGGALDGSVQKNRQACHTMLQRMKRDFPEWDPEQLLSHLIVVGKADPFHGPNLTSFTYLMYHSVKIINHARAAKGKGQPDTQYAHASASALARKLARED